MRVFSSTTLKAVLVLAVLVSGASTALGDECAEANVLYEHSLSTENNKEKLLEDALNLCPRHSGVLNNLALIRENQGRIEEAEDLYRRATLADRRNVASYAGLGDVLMARGSFREAERAYRTFLEGLEREKLRGDPMGLAAYEAEYGQRWRKALAGSGGAPESGSSMVMAGQILRSLTTKPRTRGLTVTGRTEPSIDIPILFETDSDRVRAESLAQVGQVAKALTDPTLRDARIMIEGHTDSVGDAGYNMGLSSRRAESVRRVLVERFGIQSQRTVTKGFGEAHPVAPNETQVGRSLNRRVTFVNMGRM